MRRVLTLLCLALALPVLGIGAAWFGLDAHSWATLRHQFGSVLPAYAVQSAALTAGVAVGVTLVGSATAAAVSLFQFPGRRVFEWALLLPLAMPAYVLAYAWTDALQFSGALQTALRSALGLRGPLWPDVRSLGGAIVLFVLALYPYVYLLARTALGDRAPHLLEAARLLGAGPRRRLLAVALPLARPAVAAGVALAVMETLADYGVGAYFGLTTFSTGILRAWLVMDDRMAAAQLASVLLGVTALLLWAERRARRQLQFVSAGGGGRDAADARPQALRGLAAGGAFVLCGLPVLLGFVLPVGWLVHLLLQEVRYAEYGLPLARFIQWAWASFRLSGLAALLATALALAIGFSLRPAGGAGRRPGALGAAAGLLGLGYALPGAVVAIGVLAPVGLLQARWPALPLAALVTGTAGGLMLAYLARFSSVALQSVQAGYARISPNVDETGRLLGSGRRRIFWQLHLPLLQRSVAAAALLVFVDVMKELPATLMLRPFGSDTLAVVAYNLARDERLGEAALPSLAIVAVGLVPVLLLSRALRGGLSRALGGGSTV
ncbi:MAG: iron ABC transporter permease [Rubrivivax sp.]